MYLVKNVEEKTSGKGQFGTWTLFIVTLENDEGKSLECSYFHGARKPLLVGGSVLASCNIIKGKKAEYPDAYTLEKPVLGSADGSGFEGSIPAAQATNAKASVPGFGGGSNSGFEDTGLLVPTSKANFIVAYVKDIYVAGIAAGKVEIDDKLFSTMAANVKAFIAELNEKEEVKAPVVAETKTPDAELVPVEVVTPVASVEPVVAPIESVTPVTAAVEPVVPVVAPVVAPVAAPVTQEAPAITPAPVNPF